MLIRIATFTILFFLTLLTGCGTAPVKESPVVEDSPLDDPTITAKQLEEQGRYQEAAHEYLRIAAQMPPPAQQGHQLSAIKNFLKAEMVEEAKAELQRFDVNQSYGLEIPLEFVQIQIELADKQVDQAVERLKKLEPTTLPLPLQIEYSQLQAKTSAAQGKELTALRQWLATDELAKSEPLLLKENQQQFWKYLSSLKELKLLVKEKQSLGEVFSGWLDLAILTNSTPQRFWQQALNNWQLRFPNHPGAQYILPMLTQDLAQQPPQVLKVALLLPLNHAQFGEFAQAIKMGFMAAAELDQNKVQITVEDVDSRNVLLMYNKMVEAGVDFIVGPLIKDTLETIANSRTHLPVPTLGLNRLETTITTGNLYQFALAPEDEAQEIATRASVDGHKTALTIIPKDEWGERVANAFKAEWEKQGGKVVASFAYGNDYSTSIPNELTTMATADIAFIATLPDQARQIVPLLAASRPQLSVYSISKIYNEIPNSADEKLEGVTFVDLPWILAPDDQARQLKAIAQKNWPVGEIRHARLFAMGVDAYYLLQQLFQLNDLSSKWQGQTGLLYLNQAGEIHRSHLRKARFVGGQPKLLE
jgi:hypothetical protein